MNLLIRRSHVIREVQQVLSFYTSWHFVSCPLVAWTITSLSLFYDAKLRLRNVFIPAKFFPLWKSVLMPHHIRSWAQTDPMEFLYLSMWITIIIQDKPVYCMQEWDMDEEYHSFLDFLAMFISRKEQAIWNKDNSGLWGQDYGLESGFISMLGQETSLFCHYVGAGSGVHPDSYPLSKVKVKLSLCLTN
jgi:hypothetical protein